MDSLRCSTDTMSPGLAARGDVNRQKDLLFGIDGLSRREWARPSPPRSPIEMARDLPSVRRASSTARFPSEPLFAAPRSAINPPSRAGFRPLRADSGGCRASLPAEPGVLTGVVVAALCPGTKSGLACRLHPLAPFPAVLRCRRDPSSPHSRRRCGELTGSQISLRAQRSSKARDQGASPRCCPCY